MVVYAFHLCSSTALDKPALNLLDVEEVPGPVSGIVTFSSYSTVHMSGLYACHCFIKSAEPSGCLTVQFSMFFVCQHWLYLFLALFVHFAYVGISTFNALDVDEEKGSSNGNAIVTIFALSCCLCLCGHDPLWIPPVCILATCFYVSATT